MKKQLLSVTAVALILGCGSASAQSPASRSAGGDVTPVPPPMWTGFHAGLNGGWSWSQTDRIATGTFSGVTDAEGASGASAFSATGVANVPMGGFIGGGQVGYDLQFNSFVFGVEADFQGAAISGRGQFIGAGGVAGGGVITSVAQERGVNWFGTVRGRLGYLVTPNILIYGTGGLAYGDVWANSTISSQGVALGQFGLGASRFGNTLVGWTGGAGAEMFISPRLSVKGEYLYFDLGSAKWNTGWAAVGKATSFPMFTTSESRFDGHVLRFGVNYHFNLFGR